MDDRYNRALGAIRFAALQKRTITYVDLSQVIGAFPGSGQMNRVLGHIMKQDALNNRPLFCSLVVSVKTNKPGDGFYEMAKKYGKKCDDFLSEQVECFNYLGP